MIMKRMKLTLGLLIIMVAVACGQKADDTFKKPMYFEQGLTTVRVTFPDGSFIESAIGLGTTVTWSTLAGKPLTYPPAIHTHSYNDLIDKPVSIELAAALAELGIYLGKTTTELNLIIPVGGFGIALDKTTGTYKIWQNGGWRDVATLN
jgi:hypothetical protein